MIPDADPLTYSATGLPGPLILDPAAGLVTGRLTAASAGVHEVTVTASDGQLSHSQTFTWTVTHINRAPIVANPGNQVGRVTTSASLQPAANDADGDTLTYSAIGLPPSLTIDSSTGLISGLLTTADIGVHLVTLTVSDGNASDMQTFAWSVTPANRAPVLTHPGDQTTSGRTSPFIDVVLADAPASYWRLDEGTVRSRRPHRQQCGCDRRRRSRWATGRSRGREQSHAVRRHRRHQSLIPNNDTLSAINGSTAITMEAGSTRRPRSSVTVPDVLQLPRFTGQLSRDYRRVRRPQSHCGALGQRQAAIPGRWSDSRSRLVVSRRRDL